MLTHWNMLFIAFLYLQIHWQSSHVAWLTTCITDYIPARFLKHASTLNIVEPKRHSYLRQETFAQEVRYIRRYQTSS